MRVAALYDIHGNLPALDAVLEEVDRAEVDHIVIGGDVIPGPMPVETLRRLLELDRPVQFVHGNCELAVLAQMRATDAAPVTYWGTTAGKPLPEPIREAYLWTARQLQADYESVLSSWSKTLRLEIGGLDGVLFCHGTPRSETEVFTRLTPEDRLVPVMAGLEASVIVCGHTHMQFNRMIGDTRVVNSGSVGSPFGDPDACWLLLGPDVQLRPTPYDFAQAAEQIRASSYPLAQESANDLLHPPSEHEMLDLFTRAGI